MTQLKRRWLYLTITPVVLAAAPAAWFIAGRDGKVGAAEAEGDKGGLYIQVDLSDRRLKMFEADTLVWQYPISPGTAKYPTPRGTYTVRKMVWNPRWVPPESPWARKYTPKPPGHPANPMKVVKIFFKEPVYYIHGTAETGRLGHDASHGCIRMDPEHVAEVARYIMEHGGQPRSENWFWRVLHFRSEEKPVYLKRPIRMVVRS